MIAFSLGFLPEVTEGAQDSPALRATQLAREATEATSNAEPTGQRRKLPPDYNGDRNDEQTFSSWIESPCFVGTNENTGWGKRIGARDEYFNRGDCERKCKNLGATACAWMVWDHMDGTGECSYFVDREVRDCRSMWIGEDDSVTEPCIETYAQGDEWCIVLKPQKGAGRWVGCFEHGSEEGEEKLDGKKSFGECTEQCKEKGFAYASRHSANKCICTNQYGSYGTNNTCKCDEKDDVGGHRCVYRTGFLKSKPVTGKDNWVGCYEDNNKGVRTLPERQDGSMSYDECKQACSDYTYFGRQWKNICFCGDNKPNQGKAKTCQCDNTKNVGGNSNCVYRS